MNKFNEHLKVLIIDDRRSVLNRFKKMLDDVEGFKFDFTRHVKGAITKMDKDEFDCVVTKIRIGNMMVFDLIDYIKDKYPKTAVVLSTSMFETITRDELRSKGLLDWGIGGFLIEPFEKENLILTILEAIKERGKGDKIEVLNEVLDSIAKKSFSIDEYV